MRSGAAFSNEIWSQVRWWVVLLLGIIVCLLCLTHLCHIVGGLYEKWKIQYSCGLWPPAMPATPSPYKERMIFKHIMYGIETGQSSPLRCLMHVQICRMQAGLFWGSTGMIFQFKNLLIYLILTLYSSLCMKQAVSFRPPVLMNPSCSDSLVSGICVTADINKPWNKQQ